VYLVRDMARPVSVTSEYLPKTKYSLPLMHPVRWLGTMISSVSLLMRGGGGNGIVTLPSSALPGCPESDDEEKSEGIVQGQQIEHMSTPFQNEYPAASLLSADGNSISVETISHISDLILILSQNGEALGSPELRYGLKVRVIAVPTRPLRTGSEEGMKVGGPEFFGLGTSSTWKSIVECRLPKSIFDVVGQQ
jgi:hypothetical protein